MTQLDDGNVPDLTFLKDPSFDQLEAAVAWNHQMWEMTRTRAAGGELHEEEGVTWTFTNGRESEGTILFPRLTPTNADGQLDRIIEFYRSQRPARLVGCWSLEPPQPGDLGVRLLARGFQLGWRPRWMSLNLQEINTDHPRPEGLRFESVEGRVEWEVHDLPYYDGPTATILRAAVVLHPRRVWHFAAFLGDRVVGHSVLYLTTGNLGVAGIYNVGVVPDARNQGIGKAVTIAACMHAAKMGCGYAMLNGTGERMYQQIGFRLIGYGMTWWLNVPRLLADPPGQWKIALTEAVGRGDVDALEQLRKKSDETLDAPLANGMTLIEMAVALGRSSSAEWLVAHGVPLDVLSAWDLGWKDRAANLLADNPGLANKRSGERLMTPLHAAAERGDVELARLLLDANPDLSVKDGSFGGTPISWARHFQRSEIVELIEMKQPGNRGIPSHRIE